MQIVEEQKTPTLTSKGLLGDLFSEVTGVGEVPLQVVKIEICCSEFAKAAIKRLKLEDETVISLSMTVDDGTARYFREEGKPIPLTGIPLGFFLKESKGQISYSDLISAQNGVRRMEENLKRIKNLLSAGDLPTKKRLEI